MFCKNCGAHLNTTDKACPNCGYEKGLLSGGNGFWDIVSDNTQHAETSVVDEISITEHQENKTEACTADSKNAICVQTVIIILLVFLMGGSLYLTIQKNRSLHNEILALEAQAHSDLEISKENERLKTRVSELEIELSNQRKAHNETEEETTETEIEGNRVW